MPTLLEIYESYDNDEEQRFVDLVMEYGPADFVTDIFEDENGSGSPVNSPKECYAMLKTFIIVKFS